jgi:hypothetical protein
MCDYPRYFKTKGAAAYLNMSVRLLEKLRACGTGPKVCRPKGTKNCWYQREELDAWMQGEEASVYESRGLIEL